MKKARLVLVAAAGLVLLSSGCGKIADKVGERAGEEIAERATGCENIDVSENGASAECDGVKVDTDGSTVEVTDSEGNVVSGGTGAELPDDWPAGLEPPEGTKVLVSNSGTYSGNRSWNVIAAVPGTVDQIVAGLKAQLEGAGFEVIDSVSDAGGSKTGSVSGDSDTLTAAISVSDAFATSGAYEIPEGSVGVTFTMSEK